MNSGEWISGALIVPPWLASPGHGGSWIESELPRIAENKREVLLAEDEVIVFAGFKICGLDPQFSAHSEVNPEPVPRLTGRKSICLPRATEQSSFCLTS